jgi:hypothetical protein
MWGDQCHLQCLHIHAARLARLLTMASLCHHSLILLEDFVQSSPSLRQTVILPELNQVHWLQVEVSKLRTMTCHVIQPLPG